MVPKLLIAVILFVFLGHVSIVTAAGGDCMGKTTTGGGAKNSLKSAIIFKILLAPFGKTKCTLISHFHLDYY